MVEGMKYDHTVVVKNKIDAPVRLLWRACRDAPCAHSGTIDYLIPCVHSQGRLLLDASNRNRRNDEYSRQPPLFLRHGSTYSLMQSFAMLPTEKKSEEKATSESREDETETDTTSDCSPAAAAAQHENTTATSAQAGSAEGQSYDENSGNPVEPIEKDLEKVRP